MVKNTALQKAIISTVVYSDIFSYPLTINEISYWLISNQAEKKEVKKEIIKIPQLDHEGEYFFLQGRNHIIELRNKKNKFSEEKLKKANQSIKWLNLLPSIEGIVLTGSLAMNNASEDDDIDILVINFSKTLWITRLLCIFILEILKVRRRPVANKHDLPATKDKICLNLFLDENMLAIPKDKRSLYIAHEILQATPLLNRNQVYEKLIYRNSWIAGFLPHAYKFKIKQLDSVNLKKEHNIFRLLLLSLFLALEPLARSTQLFYMKPRITTEIVTKDTAHFHPFNYETWVKQEFKKRLSKLKLKQE